MKHVSNKKLKLALRMNNKNMEDLKCLCEKNCIKIEDYMPDYIVLHDEELNKLSIFLAVNPLWLDDKCTIFNNSIIDYAGQNLKYLCHLQNYSYGEISEELNVSLETVCSWANNENDMPISVAIKLANFFQVDSDIFMLVDIKHFVLR